LSAPQFEVRLDAQGEAQQVLQLDNASLIPTTVLDSLWK
jgi:hypothetical protein